ncbi:pimeloyl-ACP methyl ester esterase BioH [Kaarinaea lacus]
MTLYTQTQGKGKDLVLIHGWGISGNVWESVADKLSNQYRVTIVDLPGYGRSAKYHLEHYSLSAVANTLAEVIPPQSIVMGWSLGGMIAMKLALNHAKRLCQLVLVATSPQFHLSDDWPHAVDTQILENFANELASSYRDTILQFLSIQALGSEHARDEIRLLRQKVFRDGDPEEAAVRKSLKILQSVSLRDQLQHIKTPTLIISGERDRLVPLGAAEALSRGIANSDLHIIKGASHAPFISHQSLFIDTLTAHLNQSP